MLVSAQICEDDDLSKTRIDSSTLCCSLQHNLSHTRWRVLGNHCHANLRINHLATVSFVLRNPSVPSSEIFIELIRIPLTPHWRENTNQHRIEPTSNLRLIQTDHLSPCHETSMFWHTSDKDLRSASARRNQEIVHSSVLQ